MTSPDQSEVVAQTVFPDEPSSRGAYARRRLTYAITTVALCLLLGIGVLDGLNLVDAYGPDDDHAVATGGGYELDVRYPTVSRPALATPFQIEVRRPGGFDGPVEVGLTAEYLSMWDENGLDPDPAGATTNGEWLVWEFDPPVGDTLSIDYDARIEPAAQRGEWGRVAVFEDGEPVVEVSFHTDVRP